MSWRSIDPTSWTSSPIAGVGRAAETAVTSLLSEVIAIPCTTGETCTRISPHTPLGQSRTYKPDFGSPAPLAHVSSAPRSSLETVASQGGGYVALPSLLDQSRYHSSGDDSDALPLSKVHDLSLSLTCEN